jgi:hypothetical protein
MRALFWYVVIKLVRGLYAVGLGNAAERLSEVTGLKARLLEMLKRV